MRRSRHLPRRVSIIAEYDEEVRSQRQAFRIPSVVVLKDYVKPQKRVAFTRFNLFLRDGFECHYCGSKGDLTFDHVVPGPAGLPAGKMWLRRARPAICARRTARAPFGDELAARAAPALGAGYARHGPAFFRRTTCIRPGWIFCIGTPSWKADGLVRLVVVAGVMHHACGNQSRQYC